MEDLLLPPPDGDVRRGQLILIIGWTECALAWLFLSGRLYTRIGVNHSMGLDDWAMILSFLFALIFVCIATAEVHYGTGRHVYYLTVFQRVMAIKLNWTTQAFHIMSTCIGKVSIVLFILRIIGKGQKPQVWFLCSLVSSLFIISLICVAFIFAQCSPAAALWDTTVKGKCWDPKVQQGFGYFTASYSTFSDVVLAVFPSTVLWKLQMERKIKISLAFVMGLGIFAAAASIVKTFQLKSLSARGDYTFDTVDLVIWMMTEQFTIIIAACIPPMRQLFVTFIDRSAHIGEPSSRYRERKSYKGTGTSSRNPYRSFDPSDDLQALKPISRRNDLERSKEAHTYTVAYPGRAEPKNSSGKAGPGGATDSDESVLQAGNVNDITKTTEVNVQYQDRSRLADPERIV